MTSQAADLRERASGDEREEYAIGAKVSAAHFTSHVYYLVLPPLFPLLRAEFDVSWTMLGLLVGVFYAASGLMQFASGFAVDRFGARPVLLSGLALLAGGTVLAGLAPAILRLAACAADADRDDLGGCAIGAEIAQARHETMQTRIFRT